MKVASNKLLREKIPLGKHNAQVTKADNKGLVFELVEGDQRGLSITMEVPSVIRAKSRFGRAVGNLRGYGLMADEQLDLSDLVGKRCSIDVGNEDGEQVVIGVYEPIHTAKY